MITYIKINGFKSFHNFEMEFTPFTVLAGVNASGKSNLFDALMLLSRMSEVKLKDAFREQRGEFTELFTKYDEGHYARQMEFVVDMLVNREVTDSWGAKAELKYTRFRYHLIIERVMNDFGIEDLIVVYEHLENYKHKEDPWINLIPKERIDYWRPKVVFGKRGIPYIYTEEQNGIPTVFVPQDGTTGNKRTFPLTNASQTVLSSFNSVDFRHILAVKEEMRNWRFLQFNPEDLRQPTSKQTGEDVVSPSGKNLAAALFRIKQNDEYVLKEISRKLNAFLPDFVAVDVVDDRENKQYVIRLTGADGKCFTSRVLSEGTLRLLALCILEFDDKHTGLLCFEEPENGIHPFRVKAMAQLLKELTSDFVEPDLPLRQVIVNTHSPVLVNEIYRWKNDPNVTIWYSQMRTRVAEIEGVRTKMNVTRVVPVIKENCQQLMLEFAEPELKLTLATVKQYLHTSEFEK